MKRLEREGGIGILKVCEISVQLHPLLESSDTVCLAEGRAWAVPRETSKHLSSLVDGLTELADLVEEASTREVTRGVDGAAVGKAEGALVAHIWRGKPRW